ncbi:MAG TPA: hydrogenase nickel incorporation protein HypB [Burkholderiaceae bacterium]|nr:hydrogenase nickel incorporation protein HypB [Burkholderiaceae bacterium]
MCESCGCALPGHAAAAQTRATPEAAGVASAALDVLESLLDSNNREAAHNREHFDAHGVLAINLMSSPGSGKTSLLEATIDAVGQRWRIAVIEGDLETENDARRIRARGVPAVQITTGSACHLDAQMIHHALHDLALDQIDVLFIENVGNLVCPASFDLGQHHNVTLLSVTEGDDKPAKYPVMFRKADLVLLTKLDLLDVLDDFRPEVATAHLRALANPAPVFCLSARRTGSLTAWIDWLDQQVLRQRTRMQRAAPAAAGGV